MTMQLLEHTMIILAFSIFVLIAMANGFNYRDVDNEFTLKQVYS